MKIFTFVMHNFVSVPATSQSFDDVPSLCANMGKEKPSQLRSCAVSPGGVCPGGLWFWAWTGLFTATASGVGGEHHLGSSQLSAPQALHLCSNS